MQPFQMHFSTGGQLVLSILLANNTDRRIRLVEFLEALVEFGQISDILTSEIDFKQLLCSKLHLRELRTLDKNTVQRAPRIELRF